MNATAPLGKLLSGVDPAISEILARALEGRDLSPADAARLFATTGVDLLALMLAADELRRQTVGDLVTFVTVRNVNFTNVCTAGCSFCAYSRKPGDAEGELLTIEDVVERALLAFHDGCTEICLQGGLNPALEANFYLELVAAIKRRAPALHIHAFSPFEILYGATRAGRSVEDWLTALRDAGLGSMPGTAAEIFDPAVRKMIAPRKITSERWSQVILAAHRLGIPTTATIMYGHVDGPQQWAHHLDLLRSLQRETGGFTEFVPLGFVHYEAPLYLEGRCRPGPTGLEDVKMHAVSRLVLGRDFKNVQVSWVKLGPKLAQLCLNAGANDFGGTLFEERISSSAGANHGQQMTTEEFCRLITDAGRIPAQRSTTYEILQVFDRDEHPATEAKDRALAKHGAGRGLNTSSDR